MTENRSRYRANDPRVPAPLRQAEPTEPLALAELALAATSKLGSSQWSKRASREIAAFVDFCASAGVASLPHEDIASLASTFETRANGGEPARPATMAHRRSAVRRLLHEGLALGVVVQDPWRISRGRIADAPRANPAIRAKAFVPASVPPATWAAIQPVFEQIVLHAIQRNPQPYFQRHVEGFLAGHLAWCYRAGVELIPAVVLRPNLIDRYLLSRSDLAPTTKASMRSVLSRADDALLLRPARATLGAAKPPEPPYASAELAAVRRWTLSLPLRVRSAGLDAALALAAGAGCTTGSMRRLRGTHINQRGVHVVVHDPDDREYPVAVLAEWEDLALEAAARAGDEYLIRPGRSDRDARNLIHVLLRRAGPRPADVPMFDMRRLRTTWLVHHLAAGTPATVLLRAAGFRTLRALDPYIELVPWPGDPAAFEWLRGPVTPSS